MNSIDILWAIHGLSQPGLPGTGISSPWEGYLAMRYILVTSCLEPNMLKIQTQRHQPPED